MVEKVVGTTVLSLGTSFVVKSNGGKLRSLFQSGESEKNSSKQKQYTNLDELNFVSCSTNLKPEIQLVDHKQESPPKKT